MRTVFRGPPCITALLSSWLSLVSDPGGCGDCARFFLEQAFKFPKPCVNYYVNMELVDIYVRK